MLHADVKLIPRIPWLSPPAPQHRSLAGLAICFSDHACMLLNDALQEHSGTMTLNSGFRPPLNSDQPQQTGRFLSCCHSTRDI